MTLCNVLRGFRRFNSSSCWAFNDLKRNIFWFTLFAFDSFLGQKLHQHYKLSGRHSIERFMVSIPNRTGILIHHFTHYHPSLLDLRVVDSVSNPSDEAKNRSPACFRLAHVKDPTAVEKRCPCKERNPPSSLNPLDCVARQWWSIQNGKKTNWDPKEKRCSNLK